MKRLIDFLPLLISRYIRSKNRQNLKYKLVPNNFADMTEEEVGLHRGLLHNKKEHGKPKSSEMLKFNRSALSLGFVPEELDWRDYGNREYITISS